MEPEQEKSVKKQSPQKLAGRSQRHGGSVGKTLGATFTCVGLACSSAQVRPSDEDCSPEARAAMRSLGIERGDFIGVIVDFHQYNPNGKASEKLIRSGPITSLTDGHLAGLPYQTIMEGRLFVVGQVLYGRYDRARTPGGQTYPVCFRLMSETGFDGGRPGPEPDTLWVNLALQLEAVDRFQFR
jgi:eukaryotic-like serine/threonine-protein kinase